MTNPIEQYIRDIISSLTCSPMEKQEIADEMRDHLYTSYEMLLADGYKEQEAAQIAIRSFGESKHMKAGFQQVVDPLYGWLRKLAWIGFWLYSFVVVWKLLIERMINRVLHYTHGLGNRPYIFTKYGFNEYNGFFDFSAWEMNVNFIPLKTIVFYTSAQHVNTDIAINNLMGNFILLLPLGLLLPFLYKRFQKLTNITTVAFAASTIIEVVQFMLQIGMADIDDILLNTVGAVIGFYSYKMIIWMLSLHTSSKDRKYSID